MLKPSWIKLSLSSLALSGGFLLSACSATLPEVPGAEENRHLEPAPETNADDIPGIVNPLPLVTEPQLQESPDLYSVVVQDIPVKEVMFALGRDANINIDVHPDITGLISMNAIDQTIPQILERISRQIDMRWSFDANNNLLVEPDTPYWETYRVDYVNVDRNAVTEATVSTALAGVAGATGAGANQGNNSSSATVNQNTANTFWTTLTRNLNELLGVSPTAATTGDQPLVVNPETGIISIRANSKKQAEVERFLNFVQTRSLHQVLIEATVVEVNLSDNYQSGVDWAALRNGSVDLNFISQVTAPDLSNQPTNILTLADSGNNDAVQATISALSQFGDLRVLSSPKIMALNNQSAILRVVDNKVYFTVEVEPGLPPSGVSTGTAPVVTTQVRTVPVGFVMTVTPQIGDSDQVTLNVRPTISRIVRYVNDPNPSLADAGVENAIPEIQIREMESVLKVFSGQIAILGGLMQDSLQSDTQGLPAVSRLPVLGNLFSYKNEVASKTELIVFIRPVVIRQPSIDGDLRDYRNFLPVGGIQINTPPDFSTTLTGQSP